MEKFKTLLAPNYSLLIKAANEKKIKKEQVLSIHDIDGQKIMIYWDKDE